MSDNNPCVSIGLPVYNGERYLRETLDSLLAQTFEDFELIISDNASTDGTYGICREYASKDCRIHYYLNDENMGAAWNFNRVFELAVGKYFKWAASDDLCAPDYLLRCVEILDRNPACVLCFPQTVRIDEFGNETGNNISGLNLSSPTVHERYKQLHEFLSYWVNRVVPVAFALTRSCVLKTTPLVGAYEGSDVTLAAELALRGEFCEIPEPLFYQRWHAENSTLGNEEHPQKIAVWYDPKNKGKIVLPRWKWIFEFLRSIRHVEMSPKEKTLCYMQVGKWALWWYKGLAYDVIAAIMMALRVSDNPSQLKQFIKKYSPRTPRSA
ncbi:MAG: glycosyltransferase [Verrucomicrobiales bacterium]|nr:glycosyltransferase [Verrucomicrobiales bacterium]